MEQFASDTFHLNFTLDAKNQCGHLEPQRLPIRRKSNRHQSPKMAIRLKTILKSFKKNVILAFISRKSINLIPKPFCT